MSSGSTGVITATICKTIGGTISKSIISALPALPKKEDSITRLASFVDLTKQASSLTSTFEKPLSVEETAVLVTDF